MSDKAKRLERDSDVTRLVRLARLEGMCTLMGCTLDEVQTEADELGYELVTEWTEANGWLVLMRKKPE